MTEEYSVYFNNLLLVDSLSKNQALSYMKAKEGDRYFYSYKIMKRIISDWEEIN